VKLNCRKKQRARFWRCFHISFVCYNNSVTTPNVWFFRRDF